MAKAPLHKNENLRLQALRDYHILDTMAEISYDDITYLASAICHTPISLVSLVDADRQWFKSHHGLSASETPREVSFCDHAIHGNDVFEVEDSWKDPRFADNYLATDDPHVRFYAGMPLVTQEGYGLGTLCVIDHQPRKLSPHQLEALRSLARQLMTLLELRKLNEENKRLNVDLQKHLNLVINQQQQLVHAAKMSSLGTMAAGIAHEINNPLAIIDGKIQIILKRLRTQNSADELLKEDLGKIKSTLHRIVKIIKGLQSFSRSSGQDSKVVIPLSQIVDDCMTFCAESLKSNNVTLRVKSLPDCDLLCRPAEISQVLLNLIINASDAIMALPEKWIELEGFVREGILTLTVTDSGPGISSEISEKMMEPFFTTKEVHKGTGLGLSISNGLIESHGGTLRYDPTHPFTRFTIELPLISAE